MVNCRVYSQNDWRWKWKKVNVSTFGRIGCTTTALTGLLYIAGYDLTPLQVAERLKSVGGYTSDLIIWKKVEIAFPKLKFIWRSYKYDNDTVKKYTNSNIPVLVEVITKFGKHWCLFLGDMKMSDPINGKVVSTSKYNPIGYSIFQIKGNNGKWIPQL